MKGPKRGFPEVGAEQAGPGCWGEEGRCPVSRMSPARSLPLKYSVCAEDHLGDLVKC